MAQTIHCEEHGLCIAQCELCVDEKHEREIAELERKLERAMKVVKAADFFVYDYEHSTDRMACSAYDRLVYALKELETNE